MNCQKDNRPNREWEILKSLPAFRYLKEPVDNVSQLYEKYPDGVERGTFAFVLKHNCFYAFDIISRTWVPAGTEVDVFNAIKELIDSEADTRLAGDNAIRNAAGIYNVTLEVPLPSGYYTAETARAAVPEAIRKRGLIITCELYSRRWITEQFAGYSIESWEDSDFWKYVESEIVELFYANPVSPFDDVLKPGLYKYEIIRGAFPILPEHGHLFVSTESLQEGASVTQTRICKEASIRTGTVESGNVTWGEWQAIGTGGTGEGGGIEEAPQDGRIYARQYGAWVAIQGLEEPSTEIIFEVTVPDSSGNLPGLIYMSSSSNNGKAVIYWGDGTNETVSVPEGISREAVMTDGSTYTWIEGTPFGHTYASPRVYEAKIISYDTVDAIAFSARQEPVDGDWAAYPVDNPSITGMKKFKSKTLQSLYYTFAGLVNMKMEEDFMLETPMAGNISFMMWRCGKNLEDFALPAGLLSQITLPKTCYRTFMESGVGTLPEGLLDSLTELTTAFEMFRACNSLGYYWYYNPLSNGGQNDFIPVTLFQKLTKLQNITGIFNYIGQGTFGNYHPSGYSYGAPIRKDLFKNTQIVTADYAFYKWNRINIETDLFGHIKNTLASAEGIFIGCNSCTPGTGCGTVRSGFTSDLAAIFPESNYPLITNLMAAFVPDKDQSALSFNGDIEGCGNHPKVKLDIAAFIAKFPNCKAGSAPGGGDGRTGAFKNLQNNCDNWDTVAAIDGGIWTD